MTNSYKLAKLGDVCEVIAGQSPVSKYYNSNGNGLPFYQGKKEFTDKFIGDPTTWTTQITKEAFEGDILMSVRAPVGPTNFATQHICIGRGLAAIRANNEVGKDYLFYFLQSFENQIIGHHGAVFNSINKKQIMEIEFPLAPLSEQKRIVSILDKALSTIEKAKSNAEQNLKNSKELFESYLQEIFKNKNEGWGDSSIKELTTKIGSGATPRGGKENYKEVGISLVRSMNVHDWEFREKNLAFIDVNQARELDGVTLQENDVLLNITGASVARCCIFPKDYLPARVNQHVSIIRPKMGLLDPRFLNYLLTSKPYKDKLLFTGEQGATRQAITKAQIEAFRISIPELKVQKTIIHKLDSLKLETLKLEVIYKKKLHNLEELKKSILQKAFAGGL